MSNPSDIPVLLLTFRRPETTRQVIDAMRSVAPSRVFFAADAPQNADDIDACTEVRALVDTLDWPCEVTHSFRDQNSGLRNAVCDSIDWFFSQVEYGIILEDDCVPDPTFFEFARELLERYRDDTRIMQISGASHLGSLDLESSYYFSRYPHIWGWATWRDRWQSHQAQREALTRSELAAILDTALPTTAERTFWLCMFDYVESGNLDTWDCHWAFTIWAKNGVSITPDRDLISNIGFGAAASNTTSVDEIFADRETRPMGFPLSHPSALREVDPTLDERVANEFYRIGDSNRTRHLKLRISRFIPIKIKRWLKLWR